MVIGQYWIFFSKFAKLLRNMENIPGNSYNLSIRISSDGFSLSVFDEENILLSSKKVSVSLFTMSLDEVIQFLDNETQINYSSIRFIFESESYTFIPQNLFKPEYAADLLHMEHKPEKNESILYNKVAAWDAVNAFAIPGTIHNAISLLFHNATIEHHLSWFITKKVQRKSETCLYCWNRNTIFDLIALKDDKLQLINSFKYRTPEDFCYFVLNIIDKLTLDLNKSTAHLFNFENKPELGIMLEKYIDVDSH
jgi:hypothetical protein